MMQSMNHWKNIGKLLVFMYLLTAVLLFLLAALVQRFHMEEKGIFIGICLVYGLCCAVGGFVAGKVQKSRKFLWGLLLGACYAVLLLLITLAVKQGTDGQIPALALNFFLCILTGMLGGMVS